MTVTTNRIYFAALIGAVIAAVAILTIGLAPQGTFFTPTAGGSAERAQAQAEEAYLDGLGDDAPALWDMPYADGVDPDTALVDLGHRACAAAADGLSWPQVSRTMTSNGFDMNSALAVTVHAEQNLCSAS